MNAFVLSRQWSDVFQIIQPEYMYPNYEVKIVNQNIYDSMKGIENTVFIGEIDNFGAYVKEWKKLDELQIVKYTNVKAEELGSKYQTYKGNQSFSSGLMFMGFFVGIAFLAMMASCLMFKVLSGASKDCTRYQMLRKIGARREVLTQSIYKELFFVFLVPAIVGIGLNILCTFLRAFLCFNHFRYKSINDFYILVATLFQ